MQHYPTVDAFLDDAEQWEEEMRALRPMLLDAGLEEQVKWGKPCFSHGGANVVILQPMRDHLSVMFFKGALVDDPDGLLEPQGPNSRSAMRIRVTSMADVDRIAGSLAGYVARAIDVEESGVELPPAPEQEWVAELAERLADDEDFREAFEGLTPGRQREYDLHISDAKRSATRISRIEKLAPKILAGKGMRDR